MIVAIVGPSGSGKTTISDKLIARHGYVGIKSYTTRAPRPGEKNGEEYFFISNAEFADMISNGMFAEYEQYSQNRFYGTTKEDIKSAAQSDLPYVAVMTPNGLRNIKSIVNENQIYSVLVEADLGTRVKRYIERCGEEKFNFDDMNEINARVNRDFGMFLGIEKQVDLICQNNKDGNISDLAKIINSAVEKIRDSEYERE